MAITTGQNYNCRRGGGGVLKFRGIVKKRESPDCRSPEVGISVIMPKSRGTGYSPIKVREMLVVPFRGLNLWIGTAFGAKNENDCCQSCLGKTYDNTFKTFLGRKCSKVMFSTIKIRRASYKICCC